MEISVIIATFNRKKLLSNCLTAVLNQTLPAYEIIVVDDASTDDTETLIHHHFPQVIYVRQEKNRGPAAARNRGSRVASGEILAFTDDDCEPPTDWLQQLCSGFEQYPDAAAIGGIQEAELKQLQSNKYAGYEQFVTHQIYHAGTSHIVGNPAPGGTNNLAVPKHLFLQVNGFDEFFPVAAGEDTDLLQRLCDSGRFSVSLPITVRHHQAYNRKSWQSQQIKRGIGAAYFHHKRGEIRSNSREILRLIATPFLYITYLHRYQTHRMAFLHAVAGFLQTRGRLQGREILRKNTNPKNWSVAASPTKLHYIEQYATGSTALDIGSGYGHYSKYLQKKGYSVTSVDINPNPPMAIPFAQARLAYLPFATSFDTVLCFDILEHEQYEAQALLELRRITKKRLLLSVPNGDDALLTSHNLTYKHHIDKTHWREYTITELQEKLEEAQFKIIEIRGEGPVSPFVISEFVPSAYFRMFVRLAIKVLSSLHLLQNNRLLADIYVVAEPK